MSLIKSLNNLLYHLSASCNVLAIKVSWAVTGRRSPVADPLYLLNDCYKLQVCLPYAL